MYDDFLELQTFLKNFCDFCFPPRPNVRRVADHLDAIGCGRMVEPRVRASGGHFQAGGGMTRWRDGRTDAIGCKVRPDNGLAGKVRAADQHQLLDGAMSGQLSSATELWGPVSGRHLEVLTTQPSFPTTVLCPGEIYEEAIIWAFD